MSTRVILETCELVGLQYIVMFQQPQNFKGKSRIGKDISDVG